MLKLVLKTNTKDYYVGEREGKKFIVGNFKYGNSKYKSVDQLTEEFENAELETYLKDRYDLPEMAEKPLGNLFDIENFSKPILKPLNFNLFEYDFFIRGNKEPLQGLKHACICEDRDGGYFYIAVEPYDSAITKKDRQDIYAYVNKYSKEIEELLGKNFSHIEEY